MLLRKASFSALLLGLLTLAFLPSCRGEKTNDIPDTHHLTDTNWTEATGQYSLHFNSPKEVKIKIIPEGPGHKLEYLLDCEVKGDSLFIKNYSTDTPFGKMHIVKDFKGAFSSSQLTADFESATMQPQEDSPMPKIVPLSLKGVVFTKK
jgi:hypothetical protein